MGAKEGFDDESFKDVSLWMHVGVCRWNANTKEVGRKIARRFWDPEKIQIREMTKDERGSFFCIQAKVYVERPFRRGTTTGTGSWDMWGAVWYERVPHICFYYGRIGHILKNFPTMPELLSEEEKDNLGYGEWMAADMESSTRNCSCFMKVAMDWEGLESEGNAGGSSTAGKKGQEEVWVR